MGWAFLVYNASFGTSQEFPWCVGLAKARVAHGKIRRIHFAIRRPQSSKTLVYSSRPKVKVFQVRMSSQHGTLFIILKMFGIEIKNSRQLHTLINYLRLERTMI